MFNKARWRAFCSATTFLFLYSLGIQNTIAEENNEFSLKFKPKNYTKEVIKDNGRTIRIRSYKYLVYVKHPVDLQYQTLNVYVPEAYYHKESINGYFAETAPIFFPNAVGGYMPAEAAIPEDKPWDFSDRSGKGGRGGPPHGGGGGQFGQVGVQAGGFSMNAGITGLFMGGGQGGEGEQGGGAPSGGGFSGGGQGGGPSGGRSFGGQPGGNPPGGMRPPVGMTKKRNAVFDALAHGYVVVSPGVRGRTLKDEEGKNYGKAPASIVDLKAAVRYLHYNDAVMPGDANKIISNGTSAGGALSALLGATGDSLDYEPYLDVLGAAKASDSIYAASCYCPITDLDHADMAYEWLFNGENKYKESDGYLSKLSRKERKFSRLLKPQFTRYLNSLNLKDRNGCSLNLDEDGNGSFKDYLKSYLIASVQAYITEGADLRGCPPWIKLQGHTVVDINLDELISYFGRSKTPPAFDSINLTSPETNLFGTESVDDQHFTQFASKESRDHSLADFQRVKMMNPIYYIGNKGVNMASYWRIRHGTKDTDTSYAVPLILATKLANNGAEVDMAFPWGRPHSGDYDLGELFKWIDSICRK
jgi:hypothetical protein